MAEPMKRAPQLQELYDKAFPGNLDKIRQDICTRCGNQIKPEELLTEKEKREQTQSGMCGSCQRGFFRESDEEEEDTGDNDMWDEDGDWDNDDDEEPEEWDEDEDDGCVDAYGDDC